MAEKKATDSACAYVNLLNCEIFLFLLNKCRLTFRNRGEALGFKDETVSLCLSGEVARGVGLTLTVEEGFP